MKLEHVFFLPLMAPPPKPSHHPVVTVFPRAEALSWRFMPLARIVGTADISIMYRYIIWLRRSILKDRLEHPIRRPYQFASPRCSREACLMVSYRESESAFSLFLRQSVNIWFYSTVLDDQWTNCFKINLSPESQPKTNHRQHKRLRMSWHVSGGHSGQLEGPSWEKDDAPKLQVILRTLVNRQVINIVHTLWNVLSLMTQIL